MRAQRRMEALHEPEDTWLDSEELTYFRFLVPMRDKKGVQALHEPERRAPARRGVACPECADLEIGAPSSRFMVPMRTRIGVGGSLSMNLSGNRRRSGGFGLENEI